MNFIRQAIVVWIWVCLALVSALALVASAMSPLIAWREPTYIIGSFAGVLTLVFLLYQPMLMIRKMSGARISRLRMYHRWLGIGLVLGVAVHVIGLWITSPPDVIDALLFRSPTAFAPWGVVAMWAVFMSACITMNRNQFNLARPIWQWLHKGLALTIVFSSVLHALLIDGTMEAFSKYMLCTTVVIATLMAVFRGSAK